MSTIDLVLLGFLQEGPMSAYDIHKQVEYRHIKDWVKIGKASIFKNIQTLEQKGFLTGRTVREGRLPEKTVYAITTAGRSHFSALMKEKAEKGFYLHFDFNAVIANLYKLPLQEALGNLTAIRSQIHGLRAEIDLFLPQRAHIPVCGRTIMKQQAMLLDALLLWLAEFEEEFTQEQERRA